MNRTILVVDDSATARNLVLLNLKQVKDVDLVVAKDGKEALEKLAAKKPHLIVTDVNMPVMNGLELVAELRKRGDQTPIIMITTMGEDQDIARGKSVGSTEYLTKPINGKQLVETVMRLLGDPLE